VVTVAAVLAASTADATEDGDRVVDLRQFDAGAHLSDDPGGVIAQDEGQGHTVVSAVLPDLQVEGAVDGYRVNPDEDLSGAGGRSGNVLPAQDAGAAELPDDDGFQLCSFA
jgi:hypothetical protein